LATATWSSTAGCSPSSARDSPLLGATSKGSAYRALPWTFLLILVGMATTYLGIAEVGKAYFYRRLAGRLRATENPQLAPGDAARKSRDAPDGRNGRHPETARKVEAGSRPRRDGRRIMRKVFEIGGMVAAAVLIAFGIGAIVMGMNGRSTVTDSLKQEKIVGTPDMTPAAIKAEAKQAGLPSTISFPSKSVANKAINSGTRARTFAQYMRIHALEASGGLTYAQMGRYTAKPGAPASATDGQGGTNDIKYAVTDAKTKQPADNGRRNVWVTETALTTALNTSYMADQLSLFGVVVGVALLLSGFGFAILAIGGALRNPQTVFAFLRKPEPVAKPPAAVHA
jgi:hypothetical protein